MNILISLAIAILVGLALARILEKFKIPAVTAYLIAGIIVGPYCLGSLKIEGLGFTSAEEVEELDLISDVALGFIAFSIGNEFRLESLKKTGKQAMIVGIGQAVVTTIVVDCCLLVLAGFGLLTTAQAITLGAIATATAPAATLMVVKQYHAEGKTVDLLLPIVALDDAVGLIVFAVSFGIAKALSSGVVDIFSIIVNPLIEIVISLLTGALLGFLLSIDEEKMYRKYVNKNQKVSILIAFVFLAVGISKLDINIGRVEISFSSLLVCMMTGTVFCNLYYDSGYLMKKVDDWTTGLLALFFVISGAELELSVFTNQVAIICGLVYIISRCIGKYYGCLVSCKISKVDSKVSRYLGITLFPQAGVALGMVVTAKTLGEEGNLIANITLFAILVYELVGPLLTKNALIKAGDIKPEAAQ